MTSTEPTTPLSSSTIIPVDIDNVAITYDGNPARLAGVLSELQDFYERKGHFKALIADGAVMLGSKLAVDSAKAIRFIIGDVTEGTTYSFLDPCPPTVDRVSQYDTFAAFQTGRGSATPSFADATATAPPTSVTDGYVINKYAVAQEQTKFFDSICCIFEQSDVMRRLTRGCESNGAKLVASLVTESSKASDADKALVITALEAYTTAGYHGEMTLKGFNDWYKGLNRLQRDVPAASRKPDVQIMELVNTIFITNEDTRTEWTNKLDNARPPDLESQIEAVRTMLRRRGVYSELASVGKPQQALVLDRTQQQALAAAGLDASKVQQALAVDPRKSQERHTPTPKPAASDAVPRDDKGRIKYWVPKLGPCPSTTAGSSTCCAATSTSATWSRRWSCACRSWRRPTTTRTSSPSRSSPRSSSRCATRS